MADATRRRAARHARSGRRAASGAGRCSSSGSSRSSRRSIGGWLAVKAILERGPDDHDQLQDRRRARGRQDQDQVQGRRRSAWCKTIALAEDRTRRRRDRGARQGGRELPGRGHALLGGAAARSPAAGLRARHAALGLLHRRRPRQVEERAARVRRARSAAVVTTRRAGHAVRAARRRPRLARRRLAGLLPARAGRRRSSPTSSTRTARACRCKSSSTRPTTSTSTPNTRFWHASGIDVSLDATGLKVRDRSRSSRSWSAGIAFQAPPDGRRRAARPRRTRCSALSPTRDAAMKQPGHDRGAATCSCSSSRCAGSSVGAPVDFRGVWSARLTAHRRGVRPGKTQLRAAGGDPLLSGPPAGALPRAPRCRGPSRG